MKIGLVSDSHDNVLAVERAAAEFRARRVGFVLHAGDVTRGLTLAPFAGLPGAVVFGNNDDGADIGRAAARLGWESGETWRGELEGRRVAMTHGHHRGLITHLAESKPEIIVLGHTHRAMDAPRDGVRFVNPGALYRAPSYTVAIYDTANGKIEAIPITKDAAGF